METAVGPLWTCAAEVERGTTIIERQLGMQLKPSCETTINSPTKTYL